MVKMIMRSLPAAAALLLASAAPSRVIGAGRDASTSRPAAVAVAMMWPWIYIKLRNNTRAVGHFA